MNDKGRILLVDDEPDNIKILQRILGNDYTLDVAYSGEEALEQCNSFLPHLILMDIVMPGINGYDACKKLRSKCYMDFVKIIMVSGQARVGDRLLGYEAGADDFITKPYDLDELKAKVNVFMNLIVAEHQLRDLNNHLEEKVQERTRVIELTRNTLLFALAKLAENRDPETGQHLERMRYYAHLLGKYCMRLKGFEEINDQLLHTLLVSAPLHDIGKVAISDVILLKPGKLTKEEFDEMKTHSFEGYNTLAKVIEEKKLGTNSFLHKAAEIAYSHHERWDGKGYPQGLKETEIPLSARLCAVADVYDALTSKRIYKKEWSHEDAMKIIIEGRGTQFQAELSDAMASLNDQIIEIKTKYQDEIPSSL
jgi:putative two-component system response regulator